jgi:hypothetical protein
MKTITGQLGVLPSAGRRGVHTLRKRQSSLVEEGQMCGGSSSVQSCTQPGRSKVAS